MYLAISPSLIELSLENMSKTVTAPLPVATHAVAHCLVVMGVSGCGKSSLADAIAQDLACTMLEGDTFHPAASQEKMAQGTPLTDQDRAGWLVTLGEELARSTDASVVLSCSALKKSYRDTLRSYQPKLRFVYLNISPATALARVSSRAVADGHFFPATLVDNQFATLEVPTGEAGVLTVDATAPLPELVAQVRDWLG
jgi:gluconokinase